MGWVKGQHQETTTRPRIQKGGPKIVTFLSECPPAARTAAVLPSIGTLADVVSKITQLFAYLAGTLIDA